MKRVMSHIGNLLNRQKGEKEKRKKKREGKGLSRDDGYIEWFALICFTTHDRPSCWR